MSRAVAILDAGMGNLASVARALERAGLRATISADPAVIADAERLVFPGQGAFRDCAAAMAGPLGDGVRKFLSSGRPFLGICLGMQVLFEQSDEGGRFAGLGVLAGRVERIVPRPGQKVPHMGWNAVRPASGTVPSLAPAGERFYFVHSYRVVPVSRSVVALDCDYGEGGVVAAVRQGPLLACQFHPEKSQAAGLAFLRRWLEVSWLDGLFLRR